jgi:hypothetical protein
MPESAVKHPLFGEGTFKTERLIWVDGDRITFIRCLNVGYKENSLPQLEGTVGTRAGDLSGTIWASPNCAGRLRAARRGTTNSVVYAIATAHMNLTTNSVFEGT